MKTVESLTAATRRAAARAAPRAGQMIGERYRLEELLESGAMGSVWRAEQVRLKAPAAIKFLDPTLIGDPEMRERFIQEARSAAAVRSVHVIQIFDYGSEGNLPYIAMELLDGENLDARLTSRGPLTPAELSKIFSEVARGLGQAHALGVVHRDVKPGNIFLAREGEHEVTKLIDFGIAKVRADAVKFTRIIGTQLGALLGTPQYMSPEQVRGSSTVDHRTDLWALAIIACECLTGRYPFPGTTIGDLTVQICTERPQAPSSLGLVPAGFDQWFFKGTSRKPVHRFTSAEQMAEALEKILLAAEATTAAAASAGPLLQLLHRVEKSPSWAAAAARSSRLSSVAREKLAGLGAEMEALAARAHAWVLQRTSSEHLLWARSLWSPTGVFVSALLIASAGLAIAWLPRPRAAAHPFAEPSPSQTIQPVLAAPARPVLAEAPLAAVPSIPSPDPTLGQALVAPGEPAATTTPEVAPAPATRSKRKRWQTPTPPNDPKNPLGPMSIAMGQAGARLAQGAGKSSNARPAKNAASPARAGARKAAAPRLPASKPSWPEEKP